MTSISCSELKCGKPTKAKTRAQAKRRAEFIQEIESLTEAEGTSTLYDRLHALENQVKKPSIDGETLSNFFKDQQESDTKTDPSNPPALSIAPLFTPSLRTTREELAMKFNEIQFRDWIGHDLTPDYRFEDKKEEFETIEKNLRTLGYQKTKESIISSIRDALQDKKDLRYVDINGIVMFDPNFALVGLPHFNSEQEIDVIFNQPIKDFVNELKEKYYGISYKVRLALLKGGNLIDIDEDSNEHITRWLIRNGYSKDETVYIIPVDKDIHGPLYEREFFVEGKPSPYTTHFDKFRKGLQKLLYGP